MDFMNQTNLTENKIDRPCSQYFASVSDIQKTVELCTYLVLGGFGIFGNLFVIVLAVKHTARKSLHFLIINMAVADTLFVFFGAFSLIMSNGFLTSLWSGMDNTTAQILQNTVLTGFLVFLSETLLTLFIISIERYRVTRRSVQISRPLSVKQRVTVIAGSWLTSLGIIILINFNSLSVFVFLLLVLVLYSSMIFLGMLTLRRISRPQAIENSLSNAHRQLRRKRIRNAVKMVLYSLLLFTFCHGPWIFHTIFAIFLPIVCIDLSNLFYIVLPVLNSCLSPVVYCVCLSNFREASRRLLCCYDRPYSLDQQPKGEVRCAHLSQDV